MSVTNIRKIVVVVDETHVEMGRAIVPATRRAVAIAVIKNPFAGSFHEDLEALMQSGEELGGTLVARAVAALGIEPSVAQSFGKAAIVGENGELEHAAAILHDADIAPVRAFHLEACSLGTTTSRSLFGTACWGAARPTSPTIPQPT